MTRIEYTPADVETFWSRVDKNGPVPAHRPDLGPCWLWTRAKAVSYGYGIFGPALHRVYRAHRFSWTITHGAIPARLHVLHKCDVPPCVRPDHLFLGTQQDNVADAISKGRFRGIGENPKRQHGESHHSAKLTPALVRELRARFADGESQPSLAAAYGIRQATVSNIVLRKTWKHVLNEPPQES